MTRRAAPAIVRADLKLLLVIPCFRERSRLPHFLPDLCAALTGIDPPVQVLPVDDGSGSAEAEWLAAYIAELRVTYPFLLPALLRPENTGKGGAVYGGWETADHSITHLALVDADGAIPPREVARLARLAAERPDAACYAVRTGEDGTTVNRTPERKLAGRVFRLLVRALFGFPVPDTQCGFKIVPAAAWKACAADLRERRFCFDVDLTWHLLRRGTEIRAVPIDWTESPGSRLQPSSAWAMFLSLLGLRLRLGRWRRNPRAHSG